MRKLGLNSRQIKALLFVTEEYQEIFGVVRMTATSDLTLLVEKEILKSSDTRVPALFTNYESPHNCIIIG